MRTPGIHRGPLKGVSDVQLLLTEPTQAEAKCRSAEQIQLKLGDMSCPKLSDELMAALRTLNHSCPHQVRSSLLRKQRLHLPDFIVLTGDDAAAKFLDFRRLDGSFGAHENSA